MRIIKVVGLILVSWVIPGSGYWFLGKPRKAIWLFMLIMLLMLGGVVLADFRDVRFIDNPFYYIGRFGSALGWLVMETHLDDTPAGIIPVHYFDIGHLYLCIAGALNIVIILNLPFRRRTLLETETRPSGSGSTQANQSITIEGT